MSGGTIFLERIKNIFVKILEWIVLHILCFYFLSNCVNSVFGNEIYNKLCKLLFRKCKQLFIRVWHSNSFTLHARVQFHLSINIWLLFAQQLGSHQVKEHEAHFRLRERMKRVNEHCESPNSNDNILWSSPQDALSKKGQINQTLTPTSCRLESKSWKKKEMCF